MPGDPPLQVASGRCNGETFLECLAGNDWDLGANGAVRINLGQRKVIVQPGKDGGLYLFDAVTMGRMYDRDQIVAICGTPADPCGSGWPNGMIRAQPVVTTVDGQKVVIVPTFMPDRSQPAGVVARKILTDASGPYFEPMWEAPPSSRLRKKGRGSGR
jgi:hypothetical protein